MIKAKKIDQFTSTGEKLFLHQEAMRMLKDKRGKPIVSHIMPTDICNHKCAFCSVLTRTGNSLSFNVIEGYLKKIIKCGLKAVIISGGGNPILFKDRVNNKDFNDLVDLIHGMGLEMGLITNGAPLKDFNGRSSWKMVRPETLDKLKWIRISMSGLDHVEKHVFVPDIDREKTTLGFSYVYHDIYEEPLEKNHGKVSSESDLITPFSEKTNFISGISRLPWIEKKIAECVEKYGPKYVRLLPNCLEIDKIADRCDLLKTVAKRIDENVVFVQYKPPKSPNVCYLGYVHPVLNSDGYVYPCDSCVLNAAAGHQFAKPWRVCKWDEIDKLYDKPLKSLIDNPSEQCPGCVFYKSNTLLEDIVNGMEIPKLEQQFEHPNFV